MKSNIPSRSRAVVLFAMLIQGAMLVGPLNGPALAAGFLFAAVIEPISVAHHPSALLVTTPFTCGPPRGVVALDSSGTQIGFSPLPLTTCPEEDYIAVVPPPLGSAGWPVGDVFVIQGLSIFMGTGAPTSLTFSLFTTLPPSCASGSGIRFDTVGSFGNQMIVTCLSGEVFTISSGGVATPIATVPFGIEGPDVAPTSFGSLGGDIFVGAEGASAVFAISPSGTVTPVASWPAAEAVRFIPPRNGQLPCHFGSSGGAFFQVVFPTAIFAWPASDFAGLGGDALVMSESGAGHGVLTSAPAIASFAPTVLGQQHEGATFVDFSVGCR